MQISIYYNEEDKWLSDKVEEKAQVERRSKSAVILAILEEYFVRGEKIGEILQDMDCLSWEQLNRGLEIQEQEEGNRRLGEILLGKNFIKEKNLQKALALQKYRSHN